MSDKNTVFAGMKLSDEAKKKLSAANKLYTNLKDSEETLKELGMADEKEVEITSLLGKSLEAFNKLAQKIEENK